MSFIYYVKQVLYIIGIIHIFYYKFSLALTCDAGTYSTKGSTLCTDCEVGYYCDGQHSSGEVNGFQKISSTEGNFGTGLDNEDRFGTCIAQLDDLDGNGVKVFLIFFNLLSFLIYYLFFNYRIWQLVLMVMIDILVQFIYYL